MVGAPSVHHDQMGADRMTLYVYLVTMFHDAIENAVDWVLARIEPWT